MDTLACGYQALQWAAGPAWCWEQVQSHSVVARERATQDEPRVKQDQRALVAARDWRWGKLLNSGH